MALSFEVHLLDSLSTAYQFHETPEPFFPPRLPLNVVDATFSFFHVDGLAIPKLTSYKD